MSSGVLCFLCKREGEEVLFIWLKGQSHLSSVSISRLLSSVWHDKVAPPDPRLSSSVSPRLSASDLLNGDYLTQVLCSTTYVVLVLQSMVVLMHKIGMLW